MERSDSHYSAATEGYPQGAEQGSSGFPPGYPQDDPNRTQGYPQVVHRKRRGLWITVFSIVIALGLALAGVALVKPDLFRAGPTMVSPTPTVEQTPGPVLASGSGTVPSADVLRQLLDPLVTNSVLGKTVRVSVVDLRTGQSLYERDPANRVIPASNAKMVTAAAALMTFGPAHRITTRAVAGANPGEVVLVGSGDATLSIDANGYYLGAGRLDDLANQVKTALAGTVPSRLVIDGSLYQGATLGPWDAGAVKEGYISSITALMVNGARVDPKDRDAPFERHPDPELAAGEAFAKLLGVTEVVRGVAPAGAAELGSVKSAPMIRQLETMLNESDNTLAESLARQVAVTQGKAASFQGAGEALEAVLAELGLPADQFDVADGSGYSRLNQLSPTVLTGLLTKAASDPRLADLFNLLPIAGWSGTMGRRFAKPDALTGLGVVRAKSGSLNGVNSITGVVQTVDGGLVGFAILAENVPTWQHPAQDALDRIVAKIASCGCG